jgi:hypothetical protein
MTIEEKILSEVVEDYKLIELARKKGADIE